jgi:hypothetical protein
MLKILASAAASSPNLLNAVVDEHGVVEFTAVSVAACVDFITSKGQECFVLDTGSATHMCYVVPRQMSERITAAPA